MQAASSIHPERFGRYVLLDRIGEGGMAEVFRAIMPGAEGFKRTLVIKKILRQLSGTEKFVDMFVREARIGAMLHHPNIVQVYDFGNVDGHYFLAMEYVRGRDVLAMIRRLRDMKLVFPVAVAAHVAHEVAVCLGYAHALAASDGHALGIVHRDVTPSNVMCLREGGVKLLDFGIAAAMSELAVEQTDQGTFKGKLPYMAPERMRNEGLDGRSDLYSLGVMLWEMLTCRRLFRGNSEAETFRNVIEMQVPPPSRVRPDVPASLDSIVLRALDRDRDKRYQTGKALADDLEDVLRECNYRSSMLPDLLADLFGSGTHSSQVAMACVPPELLVATAGDEPPSTTTGSLLLTALNFRPRLAWAVALAGAVVVALVVLLAVRLAGRSGHAARPASPSATTMPAPAPVPSSPAPPAQASAAAATVDDVAVAPPLGPPPGVRPGKAKHTAIRHSAKSAHAAGAILGGKSIDPFAEAASRGR